MLEAEGFLLPGTRFFVAEFILSEAEGILRMTLARDLSFRVSRAAATEKSLEPAIHCEIVQGFDTIEDVALLQLDQESSSFSRNR